MMLDILIRGGSILDGTGTPAFSADIGVRAGRIVAVGELASEPARSRIDVSGLVVAPGFIDVHAHDDAAMLAEAPYTAKLTQGVTTVVVGNCGFSLAPSPRRDELRTFASPIFGPTLDEWQGVTFSDYLDALDRRQPLINTAALVGHGTVRAAVMGFDDRPPTDGEMAEMRGWVKEAVDAGAFGLSSGLIYPPGSFAGVEELAALAQAVAEAGGFYASHIRDEADGVFDAVVEAIAVGEAAGLPVQISHCKLSSRKTWGQTERYAELLEAAGRRNLDVTGDVYPYDAGSTMLSALLPPWAHAGGRLHLLDRLQDPEQRQRLRRDLTKGVEGWWNPVLAATWDKILLVDCHGRPEWEGRTLAAVAASHGRDPIETLLDVLLATEARAIMVLFLMSDADVRDFLRHPLIMIGTDGIPVGDRPHPRTYETYPRVLGHYVRDEGVLELPEAVRKMTALPARRLGLTDRGRIAPGSAADLVIFDPAAIRGRSSYHQPAQLPAGIHSVWVNGVLAARDGMPTGVCAGRVLRRI